MRAGPGAAAYHPGMASSILRDPLPLLVPLAGLFAALPDEAEACSPDLCQGVAALADIVPVGPAIPIDGVLVLRTTGTIEDDALIAGLELTVTRDGQPIAGAVEGSSIRGVLVWRPAAQLEPGPYDVHATFDNPPVDYEYCAEDIVDTSFGFSVGTDPAEPLSPATSLADLSGKLVPDRELDTLLCCDGAFPEDYNLCGYSYEVSWFEGDCAELSAAGYLDVTFELTQNVGPETAGQLVRTLRIDGDIQRQEVTDVFEFRSSEPFCANFDLHNLATGDMLAGPEQCFTAEEAQIALGQQPLDAAGALAGKCTGPLYTCEVDDGSPARWDAERCTPWDPVGPTTGDESGDESGDQTGDDSGDQTGDESGVPPTTSDSAGDTSVGDDTGSDSGDSGDQDLGDRGCSCTTGPADPAALLGLAGLGLLAGRRRRRE